MSKEILLPPRSPGLELNTTESHPQSQSPLFTLPAEIRLQIYEYVLSSGQIHILLRSCTPSENPLFRITTTTSSTTTHHDHQKLTYSTCTHPSSFPSRYTLSLSSHPTIPIMYHNSRGRLPHFPPPSTEHFILPNWTLQHAACSSPAQKDMVLQSYDSARCAAGIRDHPYLRHDSRRCGDCATRRRLVEREYGPANAREGLKRFHAGSAVMVDGLVRCCRRVYDEARELPFQLNSFDVDAGCLEEFAERWLVGWQVEAVERLHVSCEGEELVRVGRVVREKFQRLKRLELDVAVEKGESVGGESLRSVERVEVVVGFDEDWTFSRAERRRVADVVERLFREVKS